MAKNNIPDIDSSDFSQLFPLSKKTKTKGTRRLVREKVLQTLYAFRVCGSDLDDVIQHVFAREFNFGDTDEQITKLLRPDEIYELEADQPIDWSEDEREFGISLIHNTLNNSKMIDEMIEEIAKNWELERVTPIDRIIIQSAVTELIEYPEIPPKVSINEAIDIAKKYSTDKSKIFVNGVLDSILERLKKDEKLQKRGRGLLES